MKKLIFTLSTFILSLISIAAFAQTGESGIGETMRSNGRIYVVVAVVVLILIGLFIYLIRLDRKLSKLEKDL